MNNPNITVVVPLFNEQESLPELAAWIHRVMTKNQFSYEVIMVNDGSRDNSWEVIKKLQLEYPSLKGVSFQRNYGKAAALHTGFLKAGGDVVITLDADLQDSPDEIPELYRMITEQGYDLVSGWKRKRHDPILSKNLPSKFYNWTARVMSGIKLHDFNCGIKAYKKAVVKSIEVYGDMHRYIPVLAKWAGYKNIGEKVVMHQERKYGVTKYGLSRFIRGPLDLLSISFIMRFGKRPMHLFGGIGTLMFLAGFVFAAYLGISKLLAMKHGFVAPLVTKSAYFYISLTFMLMGTQFFVAGFLGEMVSRASSDRNHYLIGEEV